MKFCINCVHFIQGTQKCDHESSRDIVYDLVDGEETIVRHTARHQRAHGKLKSKILGSCGKEGRFYEDKALPPEESKT